MPVSKGGTDTADNAIVLCFDCHADAGHYNPAHPRGTKYSPDELRLARDLWHAAVATNRIAAPNDEDRLYCRYLVCKSFSALREIVGKNLAEVPVNDPFLAVTPVNAFWSTVIGAHPEAYRHSYVWGDTFPDRDAYERAHPDVRIFERPSRNLFPYFEASRVPSRAELLARVAPKDSISSMLLQDQVPEPEICEAFAYDEMCGGNSFQETYRLRPLWTVFLAATNITEQPVRLHSLACEMERPNGTGYRAITARESASVEEVSLPRMPLPPGGTALIPVATILGPMSDVPTEVIRSELRDLESGEVQTVSHCETDWPMAQISLIGPALWPARLVLNDSKSAQEIHQLDLANLYIIDRYWEAGSCPHLFFERSSHPSLSYWGEMWAQAPGLLQAHRLEVPAGVSALILAELEPEAAHVKEVTVNSEIIVRDLILQRGEWVRVTVKPGDRVELLGYYSPNFAVPGGEPNPWRKNAIITEFIGTF